MDSSDLRKLRIAVVGAGYGGLSAARALSLLGADVTVHERAEQVRETGAGIRLRPASMGLFRRWGIFDDIAQVTSPSDRFEVLTADGRTIMSDSWPGTDDHEVRTHTHLGHRDEILQALLATLPGGTVRTGHRLTGITDHGDRATLTFGNGQSVQADLVIAADGIRSTVRRLLFSDQEPVFVGEHVYRAVVDATACHGLVLDDTLRLYVGTGAAVHVLPLRHRDRMSLDVTVLSPDATWEPAVTRDDLLQALVGFDDRITGTVRDLDWDTVTVRAVYDIDPVQTWVSGCVGLLGDAAHSMSHHRGQGANSAVQDAGVLAETLRQAESVPAALTAYMADRKPRTDELQRISRMGLR